MRQTQFFMALVVFLGLGAATGPSNATISTTIKLRWTAPGDDDMKGQAMRYDLRLSTSPITEANFVHATPLPVFSRPSPAGRPDSVTMTSVNPGLTLYFALKTVDEAGNWSGMSNVSVRRGVFDYSAKPAGPAIDFANPWPNPARAGVRISYTLPKAGAVNVDVFDIAGRMVRNLAHGSAMPGRTVLPWNLTDDHGRGLDAGIYLIRASLLGETFTRRVIVVR